MPIIQVVPTQAGLIGTIPTFAYIDTSDTYATVLIPGYLINYANVITPNNAILIYTIDQGVTVLKAVNTSSGLSAAPLFVNDGVTAVTASTPLSATSGNTPNVSLSGVISGVNGGTGVNNGASTLTMGGNVAFSGPYSFTANITGPTNVTFPTSGMLSTTSGTVLAVTASAPLASSGGNAPNLSITSPIAGTYGGTGVNNGSNTLTLAGNLTTSGAYASTFTMTGVTTVVFPTSGTLATVAGTVSSITGTANQIAASASTGAVTLSLANNAVMPGIGGLTLPTGTTAQRAGGAGTLRFNGQTNVFESTVDGSTWATITTTSTSITSVTASAPLSSSGGVNPNIAIINPLTGTYGGTGVNNGSSTFTISNNVAFSGGYSFTANLTNTSSVTFPTSGILATLADVSTNYNFYCQGRLTLTSGVPVTTADTTTGPTGTIYFTPYKGSYVSLYNGTNWIVYQFTELSLTSLISATGISDIFLFWDGAELAIFQDEWTNSTTRSSAISLFQGVYTLTSNTQTLYLGTTYGSCTDTNAFRGVWNYFNRVYKPMAYLTSGSWSYAGESFRQANGNVSYQLEYVVGVIEDLIEAFISITIEVSGLSQPTYCNVGIGLNSTVTISGFPYAGSTTTDAPFTTTATPSYTGYSPTIGINKIQWLEVTNGQSVTFTSVDGQGGIFGGIWC